MPPPGILVVCEGIDGSGKTTASRGIVEALAREGVPSRWTGEPSATWMGEAVRRSLKEETSPLAETFLFMADHAEHLRRIAAWIAEGDVVVSDRWSWSTFAYQGATLEAAGLPRVGADAFAWLRSLERPWDRAPDVGLLFDVPVERALARLAGRGFLDKFERRDLLERVRANYLRLAREEPSIRVLQADRDAAAVLGDALEHVRPVLARR